MFQLNKKVLSFVSLIFCIIGLFYQTFILVKDYFNGQTVVNIKISRVYNESLPAITICYPELLSFKKVAKLNDEWQRTFDEYMLFVINNNTMKLSVDDENNKRKKYYDYYRNITKNIIANSSYTELDILANFSINFPKIFAQIIGNIYTNNTDEFGLLNNKSEFKNFYVYSGPYINTFMISLAHDHPISCFTLFSWLQHKWKNFEMYIENIGIAIAHDDAWFPFTEDYEIYMVIHSGQTMPYAMLNEFIELDARSFYKMSYSRIEKNLLGKGYDTDCKNYDLQSDKFEETMRSECITLCMKQYVECPSGVLLRNAWFEKHKDEKYLNCGQNKKEYIFHAKERLNCMENCKVDCLSNEFKPEIKSEKSLYDKNELKILIQILKFMNTVYVDIERKGTDIEVRHLPKTSLISLVCSFGGLLGLWLGMSVLAIMKSSTQIIKKFIVNNVNNNRCIINVYLNAYSNANKVSSRRRHYNHNIRHRFLYQ